MTATAHSQLWEQTIRVVMILIAAYWYTQASFLCIRWGRMLQLEQLSEV